MFEYRPMNNAEDLARLHEVMTAQKLLNRAWPEFARLNQKDFIRLLSADRCYVMGGFIDGDLAGAMTLQPFGELTLVFEIGVTGIRPYFKQAAPLFLGALEWTLKTFSPAPSAFVGKVAAANRHITRMLSACGFTSMGGIPGLMWDEGRGEFTDGFMVMATAKDIARKIRGGE